MAQDNKIGDKNFVTLRGETQSPANEVQLFSRAGVDGLQALITGKRGRVFTLVSLVDVASIAAAETTYKSYLLMIGQTYDALTLHSVTINSLNGTKVLVKDVRKMQSHATLAKNGGLDNTTNGGAILRCEWDLVLIAAVTSSP